VNSEYNELFSTLGYDALSVILGINPHLIRENEIRKLIKLINLSKENEFIELEIKNIINKYPDNPEMKLKLLLKILD